MILHHVASVGSLKWCMDGPVRYHQPVEGTCFIHFWHGVPTMFGGIVPTCAKNSEDRIETGAWKRWFLSNSSNYRVRRRRVLDIFWFATISHGKWAQLIPEPNSSREGLLSQCGGPNNFSHGWFWIAWSKYIPPPKTNTAIRRLWRTIWVDVFLLEFPIGNGYVPVSC